MGDVQAFQTLWTDDRTALTHGILITPETLTTWGGRGLTRGDVKRLAEAIPHSSVPDAIGAILHTILSERGSGDD